MNSYLKKGTHYIKRNLKSGFRALNNKFQFQEFSLSDFFIIGGQKCGTTSMYALLTQHPGIIAAEHKEVHYFNNPDNRSKGKSWYLSHFCTVAEKKKLAHKLGYMPITGEATPAMHLPLVPGFTHELLPSTKLIVMLRDPVDRAFSQYYHNVRNEGLTISFENAIEESALEISTERAKDESVYRNSGLRSYITRGLYADVLDRWYTYYSQDRFHIINSGDYFADPQEELNKLLLFLGMPAFTFDGVRVSKHAGNYKSSMDNEISDYLTDIFRPHNRRLFNMIGRDFGWPI